jgi:glutamate formiminotransferase/formiminotetrahydrofolate cyclodeaminase
MSAIIECVPNFSEGINRKNIDQITQSIQSVDKVKLLDVDPGKATNRTVVTFVGPPDAVIEAAFQSIKKAAELIDMSQHKGEHPRMGATDVCPLVPISGISVEETIKYAEKLGQRVGEELGIPVYLYEYAAKKEDRKNLATIRAGEYEGFAKKIKQDNWKPDYGPSELNAKAGVTAIGVRDFLIAYNVNLNTSSVRRANAIAFDVRDKGRIKREGNPLKGKILRDKDGNALREAGLLKSVKAIGWYIEEYGIAQISMNLTDINVTSLHKAFETVRECANKRGLRVTGSELVGLVPKNVLLDAGKYFLKKQQRSLGIAEAEIIKIAVKSLGLDELSPFDPSKKVIEYMLYDDSKNLLVNKTLVEFADETASESPAPGGGSISAYVGSLGVALGGMVANLSSHKRGWDDKWEYYSNYAEEAQNIKSKLLQLVDEDTNAFNKILAAIRMPKATDDEKKSRKKAIADATKYAIDIPLLVMETAFSSYNVLEEMAETGLSASISDAGVGALCTHAAIEGAYLNVRINCKDFDDKDFVEDRLKKAKAICAKSETAKQKVLDKVFLKF